MTVDQQMDWFREVYHKLMKGLHDKG